MPAGFRVGARQTHVELDIGWIQPLSSLQPFDGLREIAHCGQDQPVSVLRHGTGWTILDSLPGDGKRRFRPAGSHQQKRSHGTRIGAVRIHFQLALQFHQGFFRRTEREQVAGVQVMHAWRLRVLFKQGLERRPGFDGVPSHPQINGLTRRNYQVSLSGGNFLGKKWLVQGRQANARDQRGIVHLAAHKRHEPGRRLIEQAQPRQQQRFVETENLPGGGLYAGSDLESTADVFQSMRVIAGFGFAQPQKCPAGRRSGFQLDEFGKRFPPVLILVAVIKKSAQIPPAFRPARFQLQGLLIKLDGLRDVVGLTRGRGLCRQFLESRGGCAGSRDQRDGSNEYSGRNLHSNGFNSHYNRENRAGSKMTSVNSRRAASAIGLIFCLGTCIADDLPAPPGSFRKLRFSPDGRYVLAQDDFEITLITVQPFPLLLRIPAGEAGTAKFTPDSRQVVFVAGGTRIDPLRISLAKSAAHVERWSISDRSRVQSTELPMLVCGTEELSPDGRVVACIDLRGTLRLVDVASGRTVLEKRRFNRPSRASSDELGSGSIDFSPDGNWLIVRPSGIDEPPLVWNVRGQSSLKLTSELKQLGQHSFAMLAPDRIAISNAARDKGAAGSLSLKVFAFPSGKILSEPKIPSGVFYRATDPGFVLIRPYGRLDQNSWRTAAVELSTGLVIVSEGALDVLGKNCVAETVNGKEVVLYEIGLALQTTVVIHGK